MTKGGSRKTRSIRKRITGAKLANRRANQTSAIQHAAVSVFDGENSNPGKTDWILKSSAGTGSLATWLDKTGCKMQHNEISNRRALLELQEFQPSGYDAEFSDDLLPETIAFAVC